MGNTVERIYAATGRCTPPGDYLSGEDVEPEATLPTTLRRLTASEFTRLRRHGFEVADATLATRLSGRSHPVRQPDDGGTDYDGFDRSAWSGPGGGPEF